MKIIKFQNLSKFVSEVIHFISVKDIDCSENIAEKGNLSLLSAEVEEGVIKNRELLADKLEIPLENFVFANQTHSDNVIIVNKEDCGKGIINHQEAVSDVDAFITAEKNVCIIILVADCVPVILFDKKKKIIAVIHAGWQGTVKKIVKKTIKKMTNEIGCYPKNIIAGIGPSIGPCHFEVKNDVFEEFKKVFGGKNKALIQRESTMFIDLWELNKQQLLQGEILNENIEIMERCTVCQSDEFFSARKGGKGRFAVGVMLK